MGSHSEEVKNSKNPTCLNRGAPSIRIKTVIKITLSIEMSAKKRKVLSINFSARFDNFNGFAPSPPFFNYYKRPAIV